VKSIESIFEMVGSGFAVRKREPGFEYALKSIAARVVWGIQTRIATSPLGGGVNTASACV